MDGTSQGGSDQHPEGAWKIAELGGEYRAYQRAGTSNGRKVMTEDHPAVRGDEILPVSILHSRGAALVVEREDICQQPRGMEAVGEREGADAGNNQPESIDRLAPRKGEDRQSHEKEQGDPSPSDF